LLPTAAIAVPTESGDLRLSPGTLEVRSGHARRAGERNNPANHRGRTLLPARPRPRRFPRRTRTRSPSSWVCRLVTVAAARDATCAAFATRRTCGTALLASTTSARPATPPGMRRPLPASTPMLPRLEQQTLVRAHTPRPHSPLQRSLERERLPPPSPRVHWPCSRLASARSQRQPLCSQG